MQHRLQLRLFPLNVHLSWGHQCFLSSLRKQQLNIPKPLIKACHKVIAGGGLHKFDKGAGQNDIAGLESDIRTGSRTVPDFECAVRLTRLLDMIDAASQDGRTLPVEHL